LLGRNTRKSIRPQFACSDTELPELVRGSLSHFHLSIHDSPSWPELRRAICELEGSRHAANKLSLKILATGLRLLLLRHLHACMPRFLLPLNELLHFYVGILLIPFSAGWLLFFSGAYITAMLIVTLMLVVLQAL
jgi:hypothetical protein